MDNVALKAKAYRIGREIDTDEVWLLFSRALPLFADEKFHNIKRAKAIRYILENYPVVIDADDLLAGRFANRKLTAEEQCELKALQAEEEKAGPAYAAMNANTGHRVVDFDKLLAIGIDGLLSEIADYEAGVDNTAADSEQKRVFYQAARISLEGFRSFVRRYESALVAAAQNEKDADRRAALHDLAEVFSQVPCKPARNFYEAIQSVWFTQFTLTLSDDLSLTGRPDQFLWPYYQQGLADGTLTREKAFQLIEALYYKTNEVYDTWPSSLMVGGVDRDGKPVLNDLTEMFIKAVQTTGLVNPSVALCYTKETPDALLLSCIDCVADGLTKPSIFNDALIIEGLMQAGMTLTDARHYIHSTCVEITPIGCSNIMVASPYINIVKGLEVLLNGGQEVVESGHLYLPDEIDIPDTYASFDAFVAAYKAVVSAMILKAVQEQNSLSYIRKLYASNPLTSCLVHDCLEKGMDSACGGGRYNYCYPCFPGFSSAVDSLAAIQEVVFKQNMVTLDELNAVLRSDFADDERLRLYLRNRCPKFGNNQADVDALAVDLYNFIREELGKYHNCLGGSYHPSYFAWITHGVLGKKTAASPDGRSARAALSECLGPVQGMDRNGPTAVVQSTAKLQQKYGIGGIATNFRFSSSLLKDEEGRKALVDMIHTFMELGGFEIQFNVVDRDTLLAARIDPEKYRTLLVRVAGYSDYFTNLDPIIQDEIINRTEINAF